MDPSHVLILYASQTGTSQYLSETLFRDCFRHNLIPRLYSLDQYPISNLPTEKYIIFLISTTGQGEPPSSMLSFWHFLLLKDLPNDVFSDTSFTIFGLGDSVYQQFNAMARKLYQRLLQLGARSFHERGLGDDSNALGHYAEFDPWTETLWKSLQKEFPEKKILLPPEEIQKSEEEKEKPRYFVEILEGKETHNELADAEEYLKKPGNCVEWDCCFKNKGKKMKLMRKLELTSPDSDQKVLYLQFEVPKCLEYSSGDVACIQPRNNPELCKKLAGLLDLNLENYVKIRPNPYYYGQINENLPEFIKIRDLFESFLDISGFPTRYFFKIMSYFTNDELHKEKLREMGCGKKTENIEDYYNYCVKEKRNVYEILFDFQSVKLPLEFFIEAVRFLKPREYSISSSLKKEKNQLGLTVALVDYKTAFERNIEGVCSGFFRRLVLSEYVFMWLKKGTLNFPKNFNDPIIMVGPGTGISPFISFLEEREAQINEYLKENHEKNINPLKTVVIFGCRYIKKDFLFHDYLMKLEEKSYITLITAFSRDQGNKVYVQNKIKENAIILSTLIEENIENIKIFISGNAKYMPQQVKDAFTEIMSEKFKDEQSAKGLMNLLQRKKQFVIDAW